MPNWRTHLEISKELNKVLKYNEDDYRLFAFGSILPDINNGYLVPDVSKVINHLITHFDLNGENNYMDFYNKYKNQIKDPLIFGYFTQIYTDHNWNQNFYRKVKDLRKTAEDRTQFRIAKQSDFLVYNSKFMDNTIDITNIDKMLDESKKIEEIDITKEDIIKSKEFLDNQKPYNAKMIYHTLEELDKLKEKTVQEIINNYIK